MNDLLTWAQTWHYPQLVLSREDIIRHGEDAWKAFVVSHNETRATLAQERIAIWNKRVQMGKIKPIRGN
jgi:hypothetical protein